MNRGVAITLLTDFGTSDGYVAAMKGIILSLVPEADIVDAAHDIAPGDIQGGAWALGQYWSWYPKGTFHLAVIDPGVGTDRAALLVRADGRVFLAPDNGVLSWVLRSAGEVELRALRPEIHRPGEVSSTFNGRDVFAYAASLLISGKTPKQISKPVKSVVMPSWAVVQVGKDCVMGEIVHVDRFGNLITNISRKQLNEVIDGAFTVQADRFTAPLVRVYAEAKSGRLVALYGSSNTLELSLFNGSARDWTGLKRGTPVIVRKR